MDKDYFENYSKIEQMVSLPLFITPLPSELLTETYKSVDKIQNYVEAKIRLSKQEASEEQDRPSLLTLDYFDSFRISAKDNAVSLPRPKTDPKSQEARTYKLYQKLRRQRIEPIKIDENQIESFKYFKFHEPTPEESSVYDSMGKKKKNPKHDFLDLTLSTKNVTDTIDEIEKCENQSDIEIDSISVDEDDLSSGRKSSIESSISNCEMENETMPDIFDLKLSFSNEITRGIKSEVRKYLRFEKSKMRFLKRKKLKKKRQLMSKIYDSSSSMIEKPVIKHNNEPDHEEGFRVKSSWGNEALKDKNRINFSANDLKDPLNNPSNGQISIISGTENREKKLNEMISFIKNKLEEIDKQKTIRMNKERIEKRYEKRKKLNIKKNVLGDISPVPSSVTSRSIDIDEGKSKKKKKKSVKKKKNKKKGKKRSKNIFK